MKKWSLFICMLFLIFGYTICFSSPDTTISIPNSFTTQTVISSSQTNANNNEISTKYNSHSHADLTSLGTVSTGYWAATPVVVQYGGTGASTLTDGGILLGNGTGVIQALGVATNGQIPIGDGTTDPVLATITGTADEIDVANGAGTITIGLVDPLAVAKGGTAGTTAATARSGIGAIAMKTGTYTGDAAATKAITGVGFQPKVVFVYAQVTDNWFGTKTDQDGIYTTVHNGNSGAATSWEADHIISIDADGFTIGDGSTTQNKFNQAISYGYICWG